MSVRRRSLIIGTAVVVAGLPLVAAAAEDRTDWLQERLDVGGSISLPRNAVYRVSRTLLVSRSATLSSKNATLLAAPTLAVLFDVEPPATLTLKGVTLGAEGV